MMQEAVDKWSTMQILRNSIINIKLQTALARLSITKGIEYGKKIPNFSSVVNYFCPIVQISVIH